MLGRNEVFSENRVLVVNPVSEAPRTVFGKTISASHHSQFDADLNFPGLARAVCETVKSEAELRTEEAWRLGRKSVFPSSSLDVAWEGPDASPSLAAPRLGISWEPTNREFGV